MAVKGDAQSVLDAIDTFCYSRHWFAHAWNFPGQYRNCFAITYHCCFFDAVIQDDAHRRPEGQSHIQSREV